jgi:hypothetical protein
MSTRDLETPEKRASGDTCIYVIGMHRSGTSATTGLLCNLGLGAPLEGDRLTPTEANERGFWESRSLNHFDESLLRRLGGSWFAPPPLPDGWEADSSLRQLKPEARAIFSAAFGPRPVAWKDPRASILLPFWNSVLEPPVAAVLVYRQAFEVASSLNTRDGLRMTHGLALWERYLRTSIANLKGLPTFVMSYNSMLEMPEKTCDELIGFLAGVSVSVDESLIEKGLAFLSGELRHQRKPSTSEPASLPSIRHLEMAVEALQGPHQSFDPPDLGVEPAWVRDTLSAWQALEDLKVATYDLYLSRPMRLARALHALLRPSSVRASSKNRQAS